jgi:hypothetical protein
MTYKVAEHLFSNLSNKLLPTVHYMMDSFEIIE